jgi:predicted PurR-regulated permease PerM/serine phosphatase RsbU (regulator of sigma subunit)
MAGRGEAAQISTLESGPTPHQSRPLVTVGVLAATIAALYFLRDIFIPIALAVLLSFMLGPAVTRLRRWGVGRVTATLLTVTIAGLVIAGITTVVAIQVMDLADNITQYQSNLISKIRLLKDTSGEEGVVERTSELIENLSEELENATAPAETQPTGTQEQPRQPIPVEVHPPKPSPLEIIGRVVGPLLGPVATAGVVVVFVIFILLYREDLRDRIIRLVSSGDLQRTTEALSEAGERVSRYLLMQLVVNATYGLPIGIGLFFIGVPNPVLWGLLATLLRFIPYAGPVIAAAFPIALSFAVDAGWTTPLLTVALFLGIELISNNVVEPWLYGASTGISSIAIIVAAVFWTWLWGPIGLLLSTPLTVCLAVMGQYVPQLRFLDVILGNAPVLSPHARFYQRLLAQDPDEAAEIAEEFIADRSVEALYDELILPALAMAEQDRHRGSLTPDRLNELADATRAIIDDYADWAPPAETAEEGADDAPSAAEEPLPARTARDPVLCVGARSALDELAAAMLAQILQRRGYLVARAAAATLETHDLPTVSGEPVRFVAICSLHASAILQIRRIVRRLRPRVGGARILACVLNGRLDAAAANESTAGTTADASARGLVDAADQIERLAANGADAAVSAAPRPSETEHAGTDSATPAQSLAQGLRRNLLQPGEIDDEHAHLCHAYWQAAEGGGDFVEAHRREDGTLIGVIAALSSESVSAALLTAAMRKSLQARSPDAADPSELLDGLESDLGTLAEVGDAISALALFYRPARRLLQVASAENPEPILLRGEVAEPVPVPAGSPLLTARELSAEVPERRTVELVLEPGDRVLFYTEGAIEIAHPERGFLEPSGLAALAREHRGFAGMSFLEHVVTGIRAFGDGEPEDDIVLLSLEIREGAAAKIPDAAD